MRTLSTRLSLPGVALVLTILFRSSLLAGPCLPVPPQELLSFLPKAPNGWKLEKSEARHSFSDWLITNATREYVRLPPEGAAASSDAGGLPSVRLRFTDTARFPRYTQVWDNFAVGKEGHIEGVIIASYPSFVHDLGNGQAMVEILIEKRFIARFTFNNEPYQTVTNWIRAVDFDAIRSAPGTDVTALPEETELKTVYELTPERNKSRLTLLITSEEVERILAEEAGLPPEPDSE